MFTIGSEGTAANLMMIRDREREGIPHAAGADTTICHNSADEMMKSRLCRSLAGFLARGGGGGYDDDVHHRRS